MNLLQVSQADLLMAVVLSVIVLLLLFVFIFIGISLFTSTGTFNTLVDSAMPVLAGIGIASKEEEEDEGSILEHLSK